MAKKKWILLILAVLLMIGALAWAFWDAIAIYVAPKSVLSGALYRAMEDLQSQYSQSPLSVLAEHIDSQGRYAGQMHLRTEDPLLGSVSYDMRIQMDLPQNQIAAQGIASTAQNDLDLSVYLDGNFMALSSDDLLGGTYYGITYETFPEDIRSIPLISMFVSQGILSDWDSSVSDIQTMMSRSYTPPQLPDISQQLIQNALKAVLLLPSDVSRVQLPVYGAVAECFQISYSAQGEQVGNLLRNFMTISSGDARIDLDFYLYEKELAMVVFQATAGDNCLRGTIELMRISSAQILRLERTENGQVAAMGILHEAQINGGYLNESWRVYPDYDMVGKCTTISYRWEPVMGELTMDSENPVTLNIFETEAGLNIQTDHFERLIDPEKEDGKAVFCNMVLQKGSELTAPEYKNIRDWSLEDLLVLLGGVGSLLGLKIS